MILRQRNFALVWSSNMMGSMGNQTEALVLGWFVLTLTDSPLYVGLITAARLFMNPLALFAGAIADRVSRNLLLATVEFIVAGTGLLMLILILSGVLQVWHIFAVTVCAGLARIFQMPTVQSLAADTVQEEQVPNAVALTNMGMNFTLIFGPLAGGLLFQMYGPEGAYLLIVALHTLAGLGALLVRATRFSISESEQSVWATVVEGLRYVSKNEVIWASLILAAIINLTGFPFHFTLLPVFARDVLGTGSAGLGVLTASFGLGGLIGSLVLASMRDLKRAGKLLIVSVVVWHGSMVVFAMSTHFVTSMMILFVSGLAFSGSIILIVTVMFRIAQPEYRGRIMGVRVLAISAHTVGSINSGWMSGLWGAPIAAVINGIAGIVLACVLSIMTPKFRRT
jgi:MFS family permease